jgi:hypothetical protein
MTKDELLTSLKPMTKDEEIQWMLALGSALTISARDAYVPGELNADPVQLMGFNELQHQSMAVFMPSKQTQNGQRRALSTVY